MNMLMTLKQLLLTDTDYQDVHQIFGEEEPGKPERVAEAISELSKVTSKKVIDREEETHTMMIKTMEENSDLKRQITLLDQQCLEKERIIERLNKVLSSKNQCCNNTSGRKESEPVNTATQTDRHARTSLGSYLITGPSSRPSLSLVGGKTSTATQTSHSAALHGGDTSKDLANTSPGHTVRNCHNMTVYSQAMTNEITQYQGKVNEMTQNQAITDEMTENNGIMSKITENQRISNNEITQKKQIVNELTQRKIRNGLTQNEAVTNEITQSQAIASGRTQNIEITNEIVNEITQKQAYILKENPAIPKQPTNFHTD